MKGKESVYGWLRPAITGIAALVAVHVGGIGHAAETVEIPTKPELYEVTPEPLQVAQCGQCHSAQFNNLKEDGRKHRFECQQCHQVFHAYNPRKNNYEEIMPKCGTCHLEPPHGENFTDCLSCHVNPHTPRRVPLNDRLTPNCGQCHPSQSGQLQQFPSKHTELGCPTCHSERHGRIPTCFECHEPHLQGQTFADCVSCHPVHKPLEIVFTPDSSSETCSACHPEVYSQWKSTKAKHRWVNCTECHTKHGLIPQCTQCHVAPHDEGILAKFTSCLDCHINPHDLPVKEDKDKP